MSVKHLPSSPSLLQYYALMVLLRMPMRAYTIRGEIYAASDHYYQPAHSSLRHALDRLEVAGLIRELNSSPWPWFQAKRGAPYELTETGVVIIRNAMAMHWHSLQLGRRWLEWYDEQHTDD